MPIKEVAFGKRAKITQAQKYMFMAVFSAAAIFGGTMAAISHFVQQIDFNKEIIMAEDQSIVSYSNAIRTTGVCRKPQGDTYSNEELERCNPNSIEVSQIPNTLRANILDNLAGNASLNSVPKEGSSLCVNPDTARNYTYEELDKLLDTATSGGDENQITAATRLMKSCSALRIIPDALPAFRNEEALLASLNKIFLEAGLQPESLSPGGSMYDNTLNKGLNALSVNLSVEANASTTMAVLRNVERSIREFNIIRATIEWSGEDTLTLQANATAYYMDESTIAEHKKVIKPGDK